MCYNLNMIRVRNAQVYTDNAGEWRFVARGGNWKTVGASEEGFKTQNYAITRLLSTFPQTETIDVINEDNEAERITEFAKGRWPFRKTIWRAAQ
jgi:uncharacterized protein YegP (UPF0339 family)